MKSSKSFFIFIFYLTLLTSCRKLVDEDFPDFKQKPVLNCLLINDHQINVQVSLTDKIDSSGLILPENAMVLVSTGDVQDTLVLEENGIYKSSLIALPGKRYDCTVQIPGKTTITASDSIPAIPVLPLIEHHSFAGTDEEGLAYPSITLHLDNLPVYPSYFEIKIWLISESSIYEAEIYNIQDPVLLNEGIPLTLFSNKNIGKSTYTMTINYRSGSYDNLMPLIVEFRSVSRNYYNYVRSEYVYRKGRYPEFGEVMPPVSLYSNVKDGYGIFAGYSSVFSDTIYPFRPYD